MRLPRLLRLALALLVVASFALGGWPRNVPQAEAAAIWSAGPAVTGRASFVLPDGRVALLGGSATEVGRIVDVATGASRPIGPWPARANLQAPVLLNDGRLFVSGGAYMACISPGCFTTVTDANIYDPATDRWVIAAFLPSARNYHSAITLRDGTVLVVGGCGGGGVGAAGCYAGGSTEQLRYDPAADRWTGAGQTAIRHISPVMTLLNDGRVLVTTGTTRGTSDQPPTFGEIFDPATNSWSRTGPLVIARQGHTATLLADGRVLVVGGVDVVADLWATVASAEIYDPTTDRWSGVAAMEESRAAHTATLLTDGQVLVAGGRSGEVGCPRSNATTRRQTAGCPLHDSPPRGAGTPPCDCAMGGYSWRAGSAVRMTR